VNAAAQANRSVDTASRKKHALVTGSSSGIGAAIAHRLLREEWRVTGLDRSPAPTRSPDFEPVEIDLTDFERVAAMLDRISAIDAFVHAAGFMQTAPLGRLDAQDGEGMWRVHVQVAAVIANALNEKFSTQGRIVLIGSRTAAGAPGRSQYAAAKAGLTAMARSWAAELAPRGITVNVVAPAATDTPMLNDPERGGTPPRVPPIGRFIQPEEVAALTSFLLSADAAAITGQQIVICGGSSL
jgi:NAD(P)-dependent dehydrogenase (short-subunit alcohol dehydrogenase family)